MRDDNSNNIPWDGYMSVNIHYRDQKRLNIHDSLLVNNNINEIYAKKTHV